MLLRGLSTNSSVIWSTCIKQQTASLAYKCAYDPTRITHKQPQNTIQASLIRAYHCSNKACAIFENRKEKALTVWSNVKELHRSPLPALILGLAGLIPFISAPAYIISCGLYLPATAQAQAVYGAVILSFLGGVRWGFTIPEENPIRPDWKNLTYSVTPPLLAWGGLLLQEPFSFLAIMGGLTFAAYFDMVMFGYPGWFKGLRFVLSFVAILSLWSTVMCKYLLSDGETNEVAEK